MFLDVRKIFSAKTDKNENKQNQFRPKPKMAETVKKSYFGRREQKRNRILVGLYTSVGDKLTGRSSLHNNAGPLTIRHFDFSFCSF